MDGAERMERDMATDWAKHVRKYAPDADEAVIAGIVRHCGIALRNGDSALVSFSDPAELERVRKNFLKKKLGLTHADDALDSAIATVGARMKSDRSKNRVTVYYLLAEAQGKLDLFVKPATKGKPGSAADKPASTAKKPAAPAKASAKKAAEPKAAPAPVAAAPAAAPAPAAPAADTSAAAPQTGAATQQQAIPASLAAAAAPAATAANSPTAALPDEEASGLGWLWLLLAALLLAFLVWWLLFRAPDGAKMGTRPVAAASSHAVPARGDALATK